MYIHAYVEEIRCSLLTIAYFACYSLPSFVLHFGSKCNEWGKEKQRLKVSHLSKSKKTHKPQSRTGLTTPYPKANVPYAIVVHCPKCGARPILAGIRPPYFPSSTFAGG